VNKFYTSFSNDWDNILLSYYEGDKKKYEKIPLKPYLFVDSALESEYKNLKGENVQRIDFQDVRNARNFIKQYEGISNFNIYGIPMYHYVYIYENFKDNHFDRSKVKILNLDLETDTIGGFPDIQLANKEINVITLKLFGSKDIYTIGIGEYIPKEEEIINSDYRIHYINCKDEKELLLNLIKIWQMLEPDVLTGWNIRCFDLGYIYKRICYTLSENYAKKLSPFGKVNVDTIVLYNRETTLVDFVGISTLDYMDVYKKFNLGVEESYSLNYISNKILNATKLDYSEYGSLAKLQEQNWEKFCSYNIIDVIRVEQIDEKTGFLNIAFEVANETKTNFSDVFGTIRVWDIMIHNYLMDRKIVVPYFSHVNPKERQISGGFVKDVQTGKFSWVMSFDFKSLYPSLCMTYNISADTYKGNLKGIYNNNSVEKILNGELSQYKDLMIRDNVNVSGCGTIFSKDNQGFIPAIMENLFNLRKEYSNLEDKYTKEYQESKDENIKGKARIFANKSNAVKTLLNSGYGAISNEHYRFFSDDVAESFTLSGQLAIKNVEIFLNQKLNNALQTENIDYIIAIDTDSVYINVSPIADKCKDDDVVSYLERFSDKVSQWIRESILDLYDKTNAFSDKLSMSLEAIGSGIWIAKKRYIMSLPSFKKIRFNPPKIKIQGIEAVRSTTPKIIREWITEAIPLLLDGDEKKIKTFIDDRWEDFLKLDVNDLAMPKGTNDLEKYSHPTEIYIKGTPQHVKGALLYNHYIKSNGFENEVDLIRSGDKVKVLYMKMPNWIMEKSISFPEKLPDQLEELKNFIDFELLFNKSFYDPLKRITDAARISLENEIDIDKFF